MEVLRLITEADVPAHTLQVKLFLNCISQRYFLIVFLFSQQSVAVQKQILKIYFALTQYVLPLDLITKEVFGLF